MDPGIHDINQDSATTSNIAIDGLATPITCTLRTGVGNLSLTLTAEILYKSPKFQRKDPFGKRLDSSALESQQVSGYASRIPTALVRLRTALTNARRKCLKTVGIFRLGPGAARLRKYRWLLSVGKSFPPEPDAVTLAHLFKVFLLELPIPLIPDDLIEFMENSAFRTQTDSKTADALAGERARAVMSAVWEPCRSLLRFVLAMCHDVLAESDHNRMSPKALGVCVGACLVSHAKDARLGVRIRQSCDFLRAALELEAGPVKKPVTAEDDLSNPQPAISARTHTMEEKIIPQPPTTNATPAHDADMSTVRGALLRWIRWYNRTDPDIPPAASREVSLLSSQSMSSSASRAKRGHSGSIERKTRANLEILDVNCSNALKALGYFFKASV